MSEIGREKIRLTGVISNSMRNFTCLRGYASMEVLSHISKPAAEIQRNLIDEHQDEMTNFLKQGEFTFFPEVILCVDLSDTQNGLFKVNELETIEKINAMKSHVTNMHKLLKYKIDAITFNIYEKENTQDKQDIRDIKRFMYAYVDIDMRIFNKKIYRIDGNHRLSAYNDKLKIDYNIPYCLIFFSNKQEVDKFSRALFHNINFKQIPIKREQSLQLIINGKDVFPDNTLENQFPLSYFLARQIMNKIELSHYKEIQVLIKENIYTYFVDLFEQLIEDNKISPNNLLAEVIEGLSVVNATLKDCKILSKDNIAILGALSFYKITDENKYNHFIKWIDKNHIGAITNLNMASVLEIFNKIIENTPQKIFLARWYPPKEEVKHHDNANYRLKCILEMAKSLKLELIDLGSDVGGTYPIRRKMYTAIRESDIFIADLTGLRPNVMVELGYALHFIGKNRVIIIHQKVDPNENVPFDLSDFKYREFLDTGGMIELIKPDLEKIINQAELGEV